MVHLISELPFGYSKPRCATAQEVVKLQNRTIHQYECAIEAATLTWCAHVQGVYPPGTFDMLQLPKGWYNALEWQYPPHQVPLCPVAPMHLAHSMCCLPVICSEQKQRSPCNDSTQHITMSVGCDLGLHAPVLRLKVATAVHMVQTIE